MTQVRAPAVAGMFYPDRARDLEAMLSDVLDEAASHAEPGPVPKAIIAPHAGYVYSGPIAASAYARLRPAADVLRRVVLIGPSHRVPLRGLAAPTVDAFETPLGRVELDRAAIAEVLDAAAGPRVGRATRATSTRWRSTCRSCRRSCRASRWFRWSPAMPRPRRSPRCWSGCGEGRKR